MRLKQYRREFLKTVTAATLGLMFQGHNGKYSPFNSSITGTKRVILDADMDSDVDDAGALSLALNMHKEGVIDLAAVVITSDDPYAPVCADAINTFFGFPEIPVGFLAYPPDLNNHSRYTRQLATEFPSGLNSWKDAESGIMLYRRILEESPDDSVAIVTVGHLSTLMGLLRSQPDEISGMSGPELIRRKADIWICMGGRYPDGKEANFYRPDPYSTSYCIDHWEREAVFYGWELGNQVITGGSRLKEMLYPAHPVYRAYELYNNFAGRASWDQLALLELTQHSESLFKYVRGFVRVAPDGSNTWETNDSGNHRYVKFHPSADPARIAKYIDNLMAGTHLSEYKIDFQ